MSAREVRPLERPPSATLRPPGSKSLTNRALLCAALAEGTSTLTGVLLADDTRAMLGAVAALGATVSLDEATRAATVTGTDPRTLDRPVAVDANQSGTTSRFLLPALALSPVPARLDGAAQLRARPFGPQVEALRALGATVVEEGGPGLLPLTVSGPLHGGPVSLPGHLSSQFLSGLLLAAPLMPRGLQVALTSAPVSVPYLTMTTAVMGAFGCPADGGWSVAPGRYRGTAYDVEPDASAASYLWAAAAVTGGTVTVEGLGSGSLQGDVAFVDLLARMGAEVSQTASSTTVRGTGVLHGIDVDLRDVSDTAQTLAAVAAFADGPTRITGIGFIRAKETDRVAAMVTELRRAGLDATEDDDGLTVRPGPLHGTTFSTYDDHRMAMSLSLLGLRVPGVRIADPGCVAKTYPDFFEDLESLRSRST